MTRIIWEPSFGVEPTRPTDGLAGQGTMESGLDMTVLTPGVFAPRETGWGTEPFFSVVSEVGRDGGVKADNRDCWLPPGPEPWPLVPLPATVPLTHARCVADLPPVPGVQGLDSRQGLHRVPEKELGQSAPDQPLTGPKEKPGSALRANVLPAVPDLLQVSACSGAPSQRRSQGGTHEWQ